MTHLDNPLTCRAERNRNVSCFSRSSARNEPSAMKEILDEQTVRHVARLARLKLSDDDLADVREQLSRILAYVDLLNELNTDDVEPTAHPLEITNVFREDSVGKSWTADAALSQAPQRQNGFFQVPRVLGQGSG